MQILQEMKINFQKRAKKIKKHGIQNMIVKQKTFQKAHIFEGVNIPMKSVSESEVSPSRLFCCGM